MPLDRVGKIYTEGIAPLIQEGYTLEQIARKTDIPLQRLQSLTVLPDFEEELKRINPEAYGLWVSQAAERRVTGRVKQQAKLDAFEHYLMLKELARNLELKPEIRAGILRDMLKIADQFKESESEAEPVDLPPHLVRNWLAASKEVEMDEG